jgi:D,D-heptose 1,7-bisphosphate phosphatase
MNQRAIFLDKDGTLIDDVPYNVDPALVRLAPGVAEGLPRLHALGFRFVVVSNQSGVARGIFPERALAAVRDRLHRLLAEIGVPLDGWYYCPHHPAGSLNEYARECACRKPRPGLLFAAALELGIALEESWMIGDILDDIEAGRRASCRTLLIDNGNETEWKRSPLRWPHLVARDMADAAAQIVAHERFCPKPRTQQTGGRL